jgi:hypothetical protein
VLGGSRARLISQLLTESAILARISHSEGGEKPNPVA